MSSKQNTILLVILSTALVGLLILFSIYTYRDQNKELNLQNNLYKEQLKMAKELSDLMHKYENIEALNHDLNTHLNESKLKISKLLDTIRSNKPKLQMLEKLRKDMEILKKEKRGFLVMNDSLIKENNKMKTELSESELALKESDILKKILLKENEKLLSFVTQHKSSYKENKVTSKEEVITQKENFSIEFENFKASAGNIDSNGRFVTTSRAKKTKRIRMCFTINQIAEWSKEKESIYLKIIDPNGKILGNPKVLQVPYNGQFINYTDSKKINSVYPVINVCFEYKNTTSEILSGDYQLEVYYQNELKGSLKLKLD